MGKKSRREREKPGKAAPSERAFLANSLAGQASADGTRVVGARSQLPNWKTDDECIRALKDVGFMYAAFPVSFDSSLLCEGVQKILGPSRRVVDRTHLLPTGPGGDHHVLPLEIHRHINDSQRDDSYFVFMRSAANNAAFLAGVRVYLQAAMLGVAGANAFLKRMDSPTPSALIIEHGAVHLVPAQAITTVSTAGPLVAALIKKRPDMASCGFCGKSFFSVNQEGDIEAVATALAGDCSHLMHENCLRNELSLRGEEAKFCPTCELPLAEHLIPELYRDCISVTLGGVKKFAVEEDDIFSQRRTS